MEITYKTADESVEIKLVYIVKHRLKVYGGIGKSWPKHTQCLLFMNGLLLGFGEVVKHKEDKDNQAFAFKEATRRVIDKINIKFMREEIWRKVLSAIETPVPGGDQVVSE